MSDYAETLYNVYHQTYFRTQLLEKNLLLEQAIKKVDHYGVLAREFSDGLGQSCLSEKWPPNRPYQIVVKTMTAEAGEVLDAYFVAPATLPQEEP